VFLSIELSFEGAVGSIRSVLFVIAYSRWSKDESGDASVVNLNLSFHRDRSRGWGKQTSPSLRPGFGTECAASHGPGREKYRYPQTCALPSKHVIDFDPSIVRGIGTIPHCAVHSRLAREGGELVSSQVPLLVIQELACPISGTCLSTLHWTFEIGQ
jgi:hypothetical protein